MFGLTESSPAWLGEHSMCEILACCAGDAIPVGRSWAASALWLNSRSRWHGPRLSSVRTSRSLAFRLPSTWLGRESEVRGQGRLWWKEPCWDDRGCAAGEGGRGPAISTCVQVTPMMDVVLLVLQDMASVSFEEGVRFSSQATPLKEILLSLVYGPLWRFWQLIVILEPFKSSDIEGRSSVEGHQRRTFVTEKLSQETVRRKIWTGRKWITGGSCLSSQFSIRTWLFWPVT